MKRKTNTVSGLKEQAGSSDSHNFSEVLNAVLNSAIDPMIISDSEGVILHFSEGAKELLGFENCTDCEKKPLTDIVPKEDHKLFSILMKNLAANGSQIDYPSLKLKGKNSVRECAFKASILKDPECRTYIIISLRDISHQKFELKKQAAYYEISDAASTSRDLNELYHKVHSIVKDLVPADNFYIAIYDDRFQTIEFPYYIDEHDLPYGVRKYKPQKFGKGLTEHAILAGKPMLVTGEQAKALMESHAIDKIGELSEQWFGVPLKTVDNKTVGLLAVQIYHSDQRYTESDMDIMEFVSTQIAMAIERKRREEHLSQLKIAVESSGEAIFMTDAEGIIRYINPEFSRLYGYHENEIIGKTTPRILKSGHHSADEYSRMWQKLISRQTVKLEMLNKTKQGTLINVEVSCSPIIDDDDYLVGYLSVHRNVTERKESEKIKNALYKISEAVNVTSDLSNLYKTLHDIVMELMPVKNFYLALYDPETEMISFPYFVDEYDEPMKPKKAGKGLTEYVLRTGKGVLINENRDLELRRKGEVEMIGTPSKIWLGVPLKIFDRVTGVMVVQDYENENVYGEREKEILTFVSEQVANAIYKKSVEQELLEFTTELQSHKHLLELRTEELIKLNAQLENSEKELQELNAAKDHYFSIIAHDLKSPFNGLLGFSNLMLQDFDRFSREEIRSYLKNMNSSIKHIFNLVENLLDWSRIQSGRLEYNPEPVELEELIVSVLKILESNFHNKSIKTSTRLEKSVIVSADRKMLISVVQNLLSNAVKFTREGGEIEVRSQIREQFALVTIRDNGVGIRQEMLKDLFKIEKLVTTEGTQNEKGTGLGLILCKEFIEKCGGRITVESKPGKGTAFTFSLPLI